MRLFSRWILLRSGFIFLAIIWILKAEAQSQPLSDGEFVTFCNNIYFERGFEADWSEMEKRLVCGDSEGGPLGEPWAEIPHNQAQLFLRTFLQARGYHFPEFITEGNRLFVRTGSQVSVREVLFYGQPDYPPLQRRRKTTGRLLTPSLLDELEAWSELQLDIAGYPCSEVSSQAFSEKGLVEVYMKPGGRKRIAAIHDQVDTGLYSGVLNRYNAFRVGDWYNEHLMLLTARRMVLDGIVEAVILSPQCRPDDVVVSRNPVLGPPRTLRIGVGGSTEEGLRIRFSGSYLRLGPTASSIQGLAQGSFVRQEAELSMRWYYNRKFERLYLEPGIRYAHDTEEFFEFETTEGRFFHVWRWDFPDAELRWSLGPSWLKERLDRGLGPQETTLISAESTVGWTTHLYELFVESPRDGFNLNLNLLRNQEDWGAPFSAQKIQILGKALWNYRNYDPPLTILGLRWGLGATVTETNLRNDELPLRLRYFAGGSSDLRGFSRQSLPPSGLGALTIVYIGGEARWYKILFERLDPLMFLDFGALGDSRMTLDKPYYWSVGGGLRWETRFGVFRGYLASGVVSETIPSRPVELDKLRAVLTFGEEF